jgi:hypothetical protein
VPFSGPENPADVSIVPLNVKLAESVSRPPVVENTTRPEVRPVLVMLELETPVRPVRVVPHCGAVPEEVMTVFAAPIAKNVVVATPDW